eukprot:12405240-Karenia_brevis.AAC.1
MPLWDRRRIGASYDFHRRRIAKRRIYVRHTKTLPAYVAARSAVTASFITEEQRPQTPDPEDVTITKRKWHHGDKTWRRALGKIWQSIMSEVNRTPAKGCLCQTLRQLGYPVTEHDGAAAWALADGNKMLAPYGMGLQWMCAAALTCGQYLVFEPSKKHFCGIIMVENKYAGVANLGIPMHLRYDRGKISCYDTLAEALADGVER